MNLKITDLIYRQNRLIPEDKCKYFIDIFKKHEDKCTQESSTKYIVGEEEKIIEDNFTALNLSKHHKIDEIKQASDLAFFYINTMIINYTLFLKKNISSVITPDYMNRTNNIRIMRYKKNQEIKDHLDLGKENTRASCTLNLNENYLGGEFTFFSGKHVETFKTGDAMIFPAEPIWIHGTKPIINGERYSINCFLKS
tara:strand:+ start:41 stop:631 length:591 start_codon:yes stop_codon:yes gene_type:complete